MRRSLDTPKPSGLERSPGGGLCSDRAAGLRQCGYEPKLAKQAKGILATASAEPSSPNELPFTGFPTWAIALIGSGMLLTGLGLRKAAS
jgi:hypothetical protein